MKKVIQKIGVILLMTALLTPVVSMPAAAAEKTADIYIIAGQSNAVGSAAVPENTSFQTDNVLYYGSTDRMPGNPGYTNYQLGPVKNHLGASNEKSGFELGVASVLSKQARYQNGDATAVIIKSAAGGTSIEDNNTFGSTMPPTLLAERYPDRDYSGANYNDLEGYQYRVLLEELSGGMEKLKQEGYTELRIMGVFWMQGESDTQRAARYRDMLPVLISDLRSDISKLTGQDCEKLPFYIGEISETFASATDSSVLLRNNDILLAQEYIAATNPYTYLVELSDIAINKDNGRGINIVQGSDEMHWGYYQVQEVGTRFANLFLETGADFDGKQPLDQTVYTAVEGSDTCRFVFPENSRSNYNAYSKSVTVELQGDISETVTEVTAENATLRKIETVYLTAEETGTEKEGRTLAPIHRYEITEMTGKVRLHATVTQNEHYTVKVSCKDTAYGFAPYDFLIDKEYYAGCRYRLQTAPNANGAVKQFIINGKTVKAVKDQNIYEFDALEQYADYDRSINIEIVYNSKENVEKFLLEKPDNILLYAGIAAGVLALGAVLLIILKKKGKK